jgi:hypothetical protein
MWRKFGMNMNWSIKKEEGFPSPCPEKSLRMVYE